MILLPEGLHPFLSHAGWGDAEVDPIPGDASFRRYFRIRDGSRKAMLMHAPPPQEDPQPFLDVAAWLSANGQRAPEVYAADAEKVFKALSDGGQVKMPIAKTFFSPAFGVVSDKLGVNWMIIVPQQM